MSRDAAANDAAFYGLVGAVLVSVGSFAAATIFSSLDPLLGAVLAVPVWGIFVYFGMKQFAIGIYAIVEDASSS